MGAPNTAYGGVGHAPTKPKVKKPKGNHPKANRPSGHHPGRPPSLTAPLTSQQAMQQATQQANLQYGAPIATVRQQQASIDPWFQGYLNHLSTLQSQTAGAQQASIDTANQQANNQTATQGINPNSQAGQDDQLAAAGRAALMRLGAQSLQGIQNTGTQFFGEQQAIAPLYAQSASMNLGNQLTGLQQQRGQAVATNYGNIRNQERQFGLSQQHQRAENAAFGLNAANVAADNRRADQALKLSNRNQAANRKASARNQANAVVTSGPFAGLTKKQIRQLNPKDRQSYINSYNKSKGSGKSKGPSVSATKTAATIRKGIVLVRDGDNGSSDYWNNAFHRLVDKDGLDPVVARAIIQGARVGKLGPHTRRVLKNQYGVTSVGLPGRPGRPKPKPTGGPPSSGAVGYPYGSGAGQVH